MIRRVYALPRSVKASMLLLTDGLLVVLAFYLALMLRLSEIWPAQWIASSNELMLTLLICSMPLAVLLRTQKVKISNFDISSAGSLALWVLVLSAIGILANIPMHPGAPRTVPIIFGIVLFLLAAAIRLSTQFMIVHHLLTPQGARQPVAIYGAGRAGMQLVNALRRSREFRPAVILDDNAQLHDLYMYGLRVMDPGKIEGWVASRRVEKVLLAIPSLSISRKRQIVKKLKTMGCELLELPSYVDIIRGGGIINSLKTVHTEELLDRDHVDLDLPEFAEVYSGRNILVTGAGGSIGSELCRKLIALSPRRLYLLDSNEFALYSIEKDLNEPAAEYGIELVPILGSVQDVTLLNRIFRAYDIEIVLHAAAYKHVPLVEANEVEAAKNNVLGTMCLAEAAARHQVKRFTLVSTDKAVRPTNFMGASKRMAELAVQELQKRYSGMTMSIVRFGNVLGSSGSVVPLFREQIHNGGPVTVTHPEVTRYFMTIAEAARLVLLAATYAEGGDVFLLDMGEPVKIIDLARRMIEMSGFTVQDTDNPDGEIEIRVIGLRPGEKLYEELLIGEGSLPTPHPKIMRAQEASLEPGDYEELMQIVVDSCSSGDAETLRVLFGKHVAGYGMEERHSIGILLS